jgi:predicted phage terminase large subunit-like protein
LHLGLRPGCLGLFRVYWPQIGTPLASRRAPQVGTSLALTPTPRHNGVVSTINSTDPLAAIFQLFEIPDPQERAKRLGAAHAQISGILARLSFAEFVKQAWKTLEPSTTLEWNWHHQLMCDVLQAMFHAWMDSKSDRGRKNTSRQFDEYVRNAVFNVPPGSLKSRIIAVCFQPWCWLHEPGMKFICLSVNEDATLRDGRMSRDLIKSEWYQRTFHPRWQLRTDQDAISNYGNSSGGDRLSRAAGSEIVGLRGDCLLIDDPNNPKEAENKLEREKINQLWDTNIFNRVNDPRRSLRIGVQQRTNAGDWTGHVIKNQGIWSPSNLFGWMHVVLPAEFEKARQFKTPDCLRKYMKWPGVVADDPRTEEGESIHKERFTIEYLNAEKERWKNTNDYAGQMQQRPAALAGALVQRKWFGWFRFAKGVWEDKPEVQGSYPRTPMSHEGDPLTVNQKLYSPGEPDFDWITISVDPAAKKTEKGSQYGLLCIAGKGGKRFLLDDRTQRGAFHEIIDIIKDMVRTWNPDTLLIEPKAAGPDLMDTLREQMLSGDCPMVAIEEADPGNSDKEMRLQASLPYIKNGALYLLEGVDWRDFVNEVCEFPAGENDDRVDALSQVLNQKRSGVMELPSW